MNIAICEDNNVMLDFLHQNISMLFERQALKFNIYKYTNGSLLLSAIKNENFDIFFLDIQMPIVGGFEIAEEIRKISPYSYIIFITANSNLVFESFDYQPFQFICKSTPEKIVNDLEKLVNSLLKRIKQYTKIILELPFSEKREVTVGEIMYVENDKHNIIYHFTAMDDIQQRSSLVKAGKELEAFDFIQIHRKFLVNSQYVKTVKQSTKIAVLSNGTELEIGRKYKDNVYDFFIKNTRSLSS